MDFVQDWIITQTLGEGAYGEVKLVLNKQSGEYVAMKDINTKRKEDLAAEVRKEIMIHKQLNHPHVIRFYGSRSHDGHEYIFLEYASHGELFDRIEPDVGMRWSDARKYLLQLLDGVDYMHSRGIAHRDIKPENLLLTSNDTLKISDFGLATVFKYGGKERALDKRCGTLPYVAPEVLKKPYAAQPADIWSCGIVLVAMLCGELPWDKACTECVDYKAWRTNDYTQHSPWHKLDTLALSLCRRILAHSPSTRYTSAQIRRHRWCLKRVSPECENPGSSRKSLTPHQTAMKRLKLSKIDADETDNPQHLGLSQEMNVSKTGIDLCEASVRLFLSQPTCVENMILSTQFLNTQSSSTQNCMQKLVRRLTRFVVSLTVNEAVRELTTILSNRNLPFKTTLPGLVTVNTVDKRKTQLVFKVTLLEMGDGTLVDFRLSRGCGLEFKRRFVEMRQSFKDFIIKSSSTE